MKKLLMVGLIFILAAAGYTQENAKDEKIKKLMELTGSGNLGIQMVRNLVPSFQRSYPNVPKEFWDDLIAETKSEDLIELIIPIYSKYYTEKDMDQLLTFYASPVGKKTITLMPTILQESMSAGQAWGKQLGQKIAQQLKEKGY